MIVCFAMQRGVSEDADGERKADAAANQSRRDVALIGRRQSAAVRPISSKRWCVIGVIVCIGLLSVCTCSDTAFHFIFFSCHTTDFCWPNSALMDSACVQTARTLQTVLVWP